MVDSAAQTSIDGSSSDRGGPTARALRILQQQSFKSILNELEADKLKTSAGAPGSARMPDAATMQLLAAQTSRDTCLLEVAQMTGSRQPATAQNFPAALYEQSAGEAMRELHATGQLPAPSDRAHSLFLPTRIVEQSASGALRDVRSLQQRTTESNQRLQRSVSTSRAPKRGRGPEDDENVPPPQGLSYTRFGPNSLMSASRPGHARSMTGEPQPDVPQYALDSQYSMELF